SSRNRVWHFHLRRHQARRSRHQQIWLRPILKRRLRNRNLTRIPQAPDRAAKAAAPSAFWSPELRALLETNSSTASSDALTSRPELVRLLSVSVLPLAVAYYFSFRC